jgi:hypothetical protein
MSEWVAVGWGVSAEMLLGPVNKVSQARTRILLCSPRVGSKSFDHERM